MVYKKRIPKKAFPQKTNNPHLPRFMAPSAETIPGSNQPRLLTPMADRYHQQIPGITAYWQSRWEPWQSASRAQLATN